MRRLLASAVVLLSAAAFTVTLGNASNAAEVALSPCAAYGEPPHLKPLSGTRLYATGTFTCASAAPGMTVTVCIDESSTGTGPWWSRGCTTATEYERVSSISATEAASVPVYATFLRTRVHGSNANGGSASFTTPPIFWFNCACYIG
jgi:hypothetical protein